MKRDLYIQDWNPGEAKLAKLDDILKRHHVALEDLHEQDKEDIWNMRYECRDRRPNALPLVLKSVNWQNHVDVAKVRIEAYIQHSSCIRDSEGESFKLFL